MTPLNSNTEAAFRDLLAFTCLQVRALNLLFKILSDTQELDLWGGDFYADTLFPIFTQMGPQLTKLNLVTSFYQKSSAHFMKILQVHVEELDNQALIILSQNTPNLRLSASANESQKEN